jgi:hypothetical protein
MPPARPVAYHPIPRSVPFDPPVPDIIPLATSNYSDMGQLQNASDTHLSNQHERLILELLPFKDASEFHAWLASPMVRSSWDEFNRVCILQVSHVS